MPQRVIKYFQADGASHTFDLGFVPDRVDLHVNVATGQTPDRIRWFKALEDASTPIYGIKTTGSSGAESVLTTAATGFASYNDEVQGVLIVNPASGEKKFCSVSTWAAATSYASGARSATAIGTIVRPPTRNGRVFELTTATAVGTSEPSSWDVQPGETVTDGGANVWTCRTEEVVTKGVQGITIGASVASDGNLCVLEAVEASNHDEGDAGDLADYGTYDFV